jgi:selenocysteine lyase/cysteine desulfurase
VPVRNQPLIRSTLPTSHGFLPRPVPGEEKKINNPIPVIGAKSPWVANFEFVGTIDNSPYLCIPEALKWRASIGGEKAIIQYNQQLAKAAAKRTAEILGTDYMDNSTGTLTNCCLSNTRIPLDLKEVEAVAAKVGVPKEDVGPLVNSWMRQVFLKDYDTFICTIFYHGKWYARWSGQVYLELADFEWAANALKEVCARVLRGEFAPETEKPRL